MYAKLQIIQSCNKAFDFMLNKIPYQYFKVLVDMEFYLEYFNRNVRSS